MYNYNEALMMAILLGMKHSMTWIQILDIINMINKLYADDILPTTKYKLFKHFRLEAEAYTFHLFCSTCEKYLGARESLKLNSMVTCDETKSPFFVTVNFTSQLKKLLNNPDVNMYLSYRLTRQKSKHDALEDIYNGYMYVKNSTSYGEFDFSYTFNTDGCQTANSSSTSI